MNPELQALARRAVACKGWRWMPGMVVHDIGVSRIGRVHKAGHDWIVYFGLTSESRIRVSGGRVRLSPDLSDPATLGCLLVLVREALGCPEAHVYYADLSRLWVVRWGYEGLGVRTAHGATEAEALVAALEAASL